MEGIRAEALAAHRPALRRFVLRHVGDEALAEDLTQETFLRVERSRSGYRGESSERSWLCAIALNVIRDHYRAAGRAPDPTSVAEMLEGVSPDEGGEHALLESEMAACIGEFLVQLPHPHHDVLALHDMAGLTHSEIASALGLSVANSRVLLHRARAALREILKRNCVLSLDGEAVPCERKPTS
ncbi:MAG: RNA polymerase sigma factor [Myxococcales bacterium]|nr:RNA polymerase sigma factor [Myxococcales bacterium]